MGRGNVSKRASVSVSASEGMSGISWAIWLLKSLIVSSFSPSFFSTRSSAINA